MKPRVLVADNAGPFTLDGTRTYLVGHRRAAVIDPGPEDPEHLQALARATAGAEQVEVLVTHWHGDHAGGARALAERLAAPVLGPGPEADRTLRDGDAVDTDQGRLVAVSTPGHAREHLVFLWPGAQAVFAGDLILGEGDTTWVGAYPGCVQDYLESLERVRSLGSEVIYPAHGPPVEDVRAALDRFADHRRSRIEQVREALRARPEASIEDLVTGIYGPVPEELGSAAARSVEAIVEHLRVRSGA